MIISFKFIVKVGNNFYPHKHTHIDTCNYQSTIFIIVGICAAAAAHSDNFLLTEIKKRKDIKPLLKLLQWLPARTRIDFKVLLMIYKALNGLAPQGVTHV